jgi:uncharacterized membrane protein
MRPVATWGQLRMMRGQAPPLGRQAVRVLALLIGVGLIARVVVAFATYGVTYDIDSYVAVDGALGDDPLQLYSIVNGDPYNRWPYPSGFLPVIALMHGFQSVLGGPFHGWVQMPQILADGAIAWLVQSFLGRHGASDRTRLVAAGLVMLGPAFALISGFHGQLDSFAILPAVAAVYAWDLLPPGPRRAVLCGLLIGVGVAIKTSPGLMLFALLPTARDNRERLTLAAVAGAVPLIGVAPWLLADPNGTLEALRSHRALPGIGGLSVIVQPELSQLWLGRDVVSLSPLTDWLQDRQTLIAALGVAPFAALAYLRRMPPAQAATLLWLAFYAFGIAFAFQYAVWGLPFALMAGYLRPVAAVQAALLVPAILVYWKPIGGPVEWLYVPLMIALWTGIVFALVRMTRGPARAPAPAVSPATT